MSEEIQEYSMSMLLDQSPCPTWRSLLQGKEYFKFSTVSDSKSHSFQLALSQDTATFKVNIARPVQLLTINVTQKGTFQSKVTYYTVNVTLTRTAHATLLLKSHS